MRGRLRHAGQCADSMPEICRCVHKCVYTCRMEDSLTIREFRAGLAKVVDAAVEDGKVTVVTRGGVEVGAFIPKFMLDKLEEWEDEQLGRMAVEAMAEDGDAPGVSLTEMYSEVLQEPKSGAA
ncbi:type II toxin-antitoxin system Phd/YefM family antitoxin [Nocardia cyriacigeorgica]|nr:type II toxin-antitoxin system Phd/YefM family antitoxin [Nocardia cyriacigeorgica]TLF56900.1 type II toxin-antitoxin system Phd/YefM family antitoxin [Nocardia cyriacigeorgica]